jgi:hypothetical protein
MSKKKHHVKLGADEREALCALVRKRGAAAFKVARARALLSTDSGTSGPALTDAEASAGCGLNVRTIERLRERACEVGPLGALERKRRETPPVPAKVTGEVEASMVKIACSEAPDGRESWTMDMIAGRLVEMGLLESISGETVRTTLKKTTSNRGSKSAGASRRRKTRRS